MAEKSIMQVRFWGVRGSHPVSDSSVTGYGGNTPCVEIAVAGYPLIFDAGTGIINLGRGFSQTASAQAALHAAIFFSHLHHDHTQGLPFFAPIYDPRSRLNFFLPNLSSQSPEEILANIMTPPVFPVAFQQTMSSKTIYCLDGSQVVVIDPETGLVEILSSLTVRLPARRIIVRALRSSAHPQGVLNYRVECAGKSVVYATDIEGYVNGDRRLVNFAQGADVLIHDAQYTDEHYLGLQNISPIAQGYGHSTASMACHIAREAEVHQLVLFHHDPSYDDVTLDRINQLAQSRFSNVVTAREGLVLSLPVGKTIQITHQRIVQTPAV